jgi:hypothetical protein
VFIAGEDQIGLQFQPLGEPVAVRIRDAYGNGVAGETVTFSPSAGEVTPQTVFSDELGRASALWTLGPAGEQHVAVNVPGLEGELQLSAIGLAPDEIAAIVNDMSVSGLGADQGDSRYFRIIMPANATRLTISTAGGAGNVDVFARHERLPTRIANACGATTSSATERCLVEQPAAGDWYVLLDAATTYSDVTLHAAYVIGGSIAVNVAGLPPDTDAGIVVTGPGQYEQHVTATTQLVGLATGTYTVAASFVRSGADVYVSAPELQEATVAVNEVANVSVGYAQTAGAPNLDIVRAYITQAVQRPDGSVPLVAGRDGLLRVFARTDAVTTATPAVRARIYHGGSLVETLMVPAPATLPVSHDEAVLTSTWNIAVPGSLIQPGMSLLLDVDPDNEVAEPDESDNHFPLSGSPLALDARALATLEARLIPVVQSKNELQGDVTEENRDTFLTLARALYPLPGVDVDVRAPYTFTGALPTRYDSTWQRLLGEVNALRVAESPFRYYYGVIKPAYTSGGTGLGYIGQPTAIGVDWPNWRAETVAHEWGHNFGRRHVDCGGPTGIDPDYPYFGGRLGHHGYDIRTNEIHTKETHHDLLSYCSPTWSSDYTYEAVLSYRSEHAGTSSAGGPAAAFAPQPSLLVWGRIAPDGVVLEPSFEIVATPVLPGAPGRYRLTGSNAAGATVLDMSFDAWEVDHLPGVRLFAYAVPLSAMGGQAPTELRLRGAGADVVHRQTAAAVVHDVRVEREAPDRVRVRWDAARSPVLMVRDGRTGDILSFARGGDAHVTTAAAEVEITMSDGVKSTMRRLAVPQ